MPRSRSASRLQHAARRMLSPALGPVDGRVADINRRVTEVHASVADGVGEVTHVLTSQTQSLASQTQVLAESLAESLAVYARAANETTAYAGIELRRVDETLLQIAQAIREGSERTQGAIREGTERMQSLAEDAYRERLTSALDLPLEKVDGPLAHLVNHAASHRGFAAQGNLWFNPPAIVEVNEGRAFIAAVNERIVEVPFSMAALGRVSPPARVLDIGSAESTFPLSAASLGYQVTALDL